MEETKYRLARKRAAEHNSLLNSCDTAQDVVHIERTRLLSIERGQKLPYPEEIVAMAQAYDAPELCDDFCTAHCPIRAGRTPLQHEDLNRISAQLMSALYFLQSANDMIFGILEDGAVTPDELDAFRKALQLLGKVSYSTQSLELWAKKNGLI